MSEHIEDHFRTPRTQFQTGLDRLELMRTRPLRPILWDVLGAIGVTLFMCSLYWLAVVL